VEVLRTRTVVLPDSRGGEQFLRVTWHPASSTIVFSHWNGTLCTASTPLRLTDATRLIDLLVGALRDVAEDTSARQGRQSGPRWASHLERAWARLAHRGARL
jgi:hypothetical protein